MKISLSPPLCIYELGKRSNQEDSVYPAFGQATAASRVFVVCDGMGGHEGGEVASSIVCNTLGGQITSALDSGAPFTEAIFRDALRNAYTALDKKNEGRQGRKMGTTLTLLLFHKGGAFAAYIGDSRIYHLRPATREVRYCTRDHSLVYDLFEVGAITREEIKHHPQRNVITRAMMPDESNSSEPEIIYIRDVQPGDYFYLCTDGMLEQMEDESILDIFCDPNISDTQKRERLIEVTANNADNHSAYIIHIKKAEGESGDNTYPDNEAEKRAANIILNAPSEEDVVTVDVTDSEDGNKATPNPTHLPPTPQVVNEQMPVPNFPQAESVESKKNENNLALIAGIIAVLALVLAGIAYYVFFYTDVSQNPTTQTEQHSIAIKQASNEKLSTDNDIIIDAKTNTIAPTANNTKHIIVQKQSSGTSKEEKAKINGKQQQSGLTNSQSFEPAPTQLPQTETQKQEQINIPNT